MNSTLHQAIFGAPKVRKTWKNSLSAEKNQARLEQMRFCKQVRKLLGDDYQVEFHFNPGGVAVWGETYIHISKVHVGEWTNAPSDFVPDPKACRSVKPVVEACLSVTFSYIRQWDGRGSGRNIGIRYTDHTDLVLFVHTVRTLAARPFVRF